MAWNEPGRNRNPWGNRPGQGQNDLDEALRNLQRKLSSIFGGGGSGGGESEGGGAARGFGFATVVIVLLAIWALTGIYKVDAAERAGITVLRLPPAFVQEQSNSALTGAIERAAQRINVRRSNGCIGSAMITPRTVCDSPGSAAR